MLFCHLNGLIGQDTFSIIAVDPETGEVGSAGASCVDASAFGGVILLNDIIPGRGGVNAQATVCLPVHINLVNAMARMEEGFSPAEIIEWLVENDACSSGNHTNRQYGIADFDPEGNPRAAAFTGSNCIAYAGHRVGANYAIQGNILLGQQIIDSMEARFLAEEGPLAKKLMAALQGANVAGADTRCMAQGTSSRSAFLRVAKPDDQPGNFWLELNVVLTPVGVEPIDSLQKLFDAWWQTVNTSDKKQESRSVRIWPNPASHEVTIEYDPPGGADARLLVYDTTGKLLVQRQLAHGRQLLRLDKDWATQLLLLKIIGEKGQLHHVEKLLLLPHD